MTKDPKKKLTITREELKRRREALGFNVSELAYYLDVDPATLLRWERGPVEGQRGGVISSPAMLAHALNDIERRRKRK